MTSTFRVPSFSSFSLGACAGLLACLAFGAGCATGPMEERIGGGDDVEVEPILASSVVVADQSAVAGAEVLEDRVRLPGAAGERYRTLAAGSIFVGARGAADGKNPDGFLRRVVSVAEEPGAVVVMTTPAALTDAIVHGAVRTSSGNGGVLLDDHGAGAQSVGPLVRKEFRGIEIDFADKPLFDGVDEIEVGGKKARFVESIRLDRAVLTAKPVVNVDLRIHDGKVSRFTAKVEGNLDTMVRATAVVTAEGDTNDAILAALRERKHEVNRVIYQSARTRLPTISVGAVPVNPTVQFTVTLRCQLSFGGALVAHAGVDAKSLVRLGAVYDGAAWGPPIRSEFDIRPTFTMDRGGEVDARCAIQADAELSAYGTSGVTMSVAPFVDFDAKGDGASPRQYRFRAQAGANGSMRGHADVFGVRSEDLSRELVEWQGPAPLEGTAH